MLKILCIRGEIAPEEQFPLLSTIFCYLMLDFCVKTRTKFSLRDKQSGGDEGQLSVCHFIRTVVRCLVLLHVCFFYPSKGKDFCLFL